jgi:hypothetical protein
MPGPIRIPVASLQGCYALHLLAKKTRDKKEGPLKRRWCNNRARFGKDTAEMENDKVVA